MPADLLIRIKAEDAGVRGSLKGVADSVEDLGKSTFSPTKLLGGFMDTLGKVGLAGLGVETALSAVSGAVSSLIGPALDAQQVTAQLQSVLTSTGGKAGVTQDAVEALSDSLSKVTTFEDEAITSGQSLLLTFTNIGSEVFPQATETMLNMSQALGQDLKSSAVQLGKALNDPINGMTALSRVGVSFTDQQKDQIKVLQESGDIVGAQTIILKELETEFGGAARAAGETFGGQLTILKNQFGNLLEVIGGPVLQVLQELLKAILPLVQQFGTWLPGAIDETVGWLEQLAEQFSGVTAMVGTLVEAFQRDVLPVLVNFAQFVQENAQPILTALAVVLGTVVVPAFVAWAAAATASAAATVIALAPVLLPLAAIGAAVFVMRKAWDENWGGVQEKTAAVWSFLSREIFAPIAETFANLTAELLPELQQTWAAVWQAIQTVTATVAAAVQTAVATLAQWWSDHFDTISQVATLVMDSVRTVVVTTMDVLKDVILAFLRLLRGDWAGAWEAVQQAAADAWAGVQRITANAIELLKDTFGRAGGALVDLLKSSFAAKIEEFRALVREKVAAIAALLPQNSPALEGPLSETPDWTDNVLGVGNESLPSRLDFARAAVKTAAGDIGSAWERAEDRVDTASRQMADDLIRVIQQNRAAETTSKTATDTIRSGWVKAAEAFTAAANQGQEQINGWLQGMRAFNDTASQGQELLNGWTQGMRAFKDAANQGQEAVNGWVQGMNAYKAITESSTAATDALVAAVGKVTTFPQPGGGTTTVTQVANQVGYAETKTTSTGSTAPPAPQQSTFGTKREDNGEVWYGEFQPGGIFVPYHKAALGGPIWARQANWVGERGPELFVPNTSGTIVPNHALGGMAGSGIDYDRLAAALAAQPVYVTVDGRVLGTAVRTQDRRYAQSNAGPNGVGSIGGIGGLA